MSARAQSLDDRLLLNVEVDPVRCPLEINLAEVKLQRLGLARKFLLFVLRRPLLSVQRFERSEALERFEPNKAVERLDDLNGWNRA